MKVIDGKHYIDGGPRCDWIWHGFNDDGSTNPTMNLQLATPESTHRDDCRGCHGTGVIPVEEWPDAVKAEWFWDNGLRFQINSGVSSKYYVSTWRIGTKVIFSGSFTDFSAALTAAVIAVAEEER